MAVGPERVAPRWCPRGVEQALLNHQNKGTLGVLTQRDLLLADGHFLQRPRDVHGSRPSARSALSGSRLRKRIVDLTHPRSVPEPPQLPPVASGKPFTRHAPELPGRDVQQRRPCAGKLTPVPDWSSGLDDAAQPPRFIRQRVRDRSRPTLRKRPAHSVYGGTQHQSEGSRSRLFQRQERVQRDPPERGPRALRPKGARANPPAD